jgi:LuxR family maltose regulon positive regulatory protein
MQTVPATPSFALAKIQPPRPRAGLIERPELERTLAAALQHSRLTLLVAPAGFGKTAALTRQIRLLPEGCALAWVSADEDDQLERFLACLTAALEPHDLPWRVAPEALATLTQAERGLRNVAGELVNALAAGEAAHGLIVIDDAHRIADPRVFELLQLVIERLPGRWSVAIASRVEPPLALASWPSSASTTCVSTRPTSRRCLPMRRPRCAPPAPANCSLAPMAGPRVCASASRCVWRRQWGARAAPR